MSKEINISDYMNFGELQRLGVRELGTGKIVEYLDISNNKHYYFKYAQSRHRDATLQPFKANKSECGYKVQRLVDEDTAVKCETITLEGHYGSIQEVIPQKKWCFDFKDWQDGLDDEMPADILADLLREFVTDYLLCNFDSHPGNFIIREDGRVIGIDKEQAFKYMNDDEAKHLSFKYHPNARFDEREPIYNTIFRRYAKGELDIDFNPVIENIKRISKIDNSEYREIFRKNVEMNSTNEFTSEEFLDKIVARKEKFLLEFLEFKELLDMKRNYNQEQE